MSTIHPPKELKNCSTLDFISDHSKKKGKFSLALKHELGRPEEGIIRSTICPMGRWGAVRFAAKQAKEVRARLLLNGDHCGRKSEEKLLEWVGIKTTSSREKGSIDNISSSTVTLNSTAFLLLPLPGEKLLCFPVKNFYIRFLRIEPLTEWMIIW